MAKLRIVCDFKMALTPLCPGNRGACGNCVVITSKIRSFCRLQGSKSHRAALLAQFFTEKLVHLLYDEQYCLCFPVRMAFLVLTSSSGNNKIPHISQYQISVKIIGYCLRSIVYNISRAEGFTEVKIPFLYKQNYPGLFSLDIGQRGFSRREVLS